MTSTNSSSRREFHSTFVASRHPPRLLRRIHLVSSDLRGHRSSPPVGMPVHEPIRAPFLEPVQGVLLRIPQYTITTNREPVETHTPL